jgi:hypothetical protein
MISWRLRKARCVSFATSKQSSVTRFCGIDRLSAGTQPLLSSACSESTSWIASSNRRCSLPNEAAQAVDTRRSSALSRRSSSRCR